MAALAGALPSGLALSSPDKWCRLPVPAACCRLQPGDDLLRRRRMVPVEGATLKDPLDRFRHVEVRAAQRREEHHDPVGEEPEDERRRMVPGEVIPDQEHPEGW